MKVLKSINVCLQTIEAEFTIQLLSIKWPIIYKILVNKLI